MKVIIINFFFLLLLQVLLHHTVVTNCHTSPEEILANNFPIPQFNISMDLPPLQRYSNVASYFKNSLHLLQNKFVDQITTASGIPYFGRVIISLSYFLRFVLPQNDMVRDTDAWADLTGVSKGFLYILQMTYELTAHPEFEGNKMCTSIIITNSSGDTFHGRNLDYFYQNYFSDLLYRANVHKNDKLIYQADTVAAYYGVISAMKPYAYTVSLNEKRTGTLFGNLFNGLVLNYTGSTQIIRDALFVADTYEKALNLFVNEPITSPAYYIIAGINPYEGAVVSRNPTSAENVSYITNENWFICQTNYDLDLPDPADDYRRVPCEEKVSAYGQGINFDDVFTILSESPNFNTNKMYTLESIVMDASIKYMNSTVWLWEDNLTQNSNSALKAFLN